MAEKGRLPPQLTVAWVKLKKDLVAKVDKAVGAEADPDAKKKVKKGLKALFKTFDAGLKKQMAKASDATDDDVAKKALTKVSKICKTYKKGTKAAITDILKEADPNLDDMVGVTKALGGKITRTLKAIDTAAAATLSAMP